jgi:Type IV pilin-like G and H, putative
MKALLRSILYCLMLGTSAQAEPTITTTTSQNQQSLVGTWSWKLLNVPIIFIFDNNGVISALGEKTYGDYKYYEFPGADYSKLMNRISGGSSKVDPPLKYKQQGNTLEVTNSSGEIEKNVLNFTNDGRRVNLTKEGEPEILVSFEKVSDSTEFPKNTESLATVESHFNGLRKLVALQVAQSDYWLQKRRFAKQLQALNVKSLPESDQLYRYELVKQSPRQNIIAAIPTQPNLRSFVLQLDRVGRRQQPFKGILCATDRPNAPTLPLPQLKGKNLTCPTMTHSIDFNSLIRKSLRFGDKP